MYKFAFKLSKFYSSEIIKLDFRMEVANNA